MSRHNPFSDGLLSGRRLLEAREFYSPWDTEVTADVAFARWMQRVAVQTELGSAREIAGLSDAQLETLESEFMRCQRRPQPELVRRSMRAGALVGGFGCVALAVGAGAAFFGVAVAQGVALQWLGVILLFSALSCAAVSFLSASNSLNLDLAYGTTGLYVGQLDEQHPWLYKTMSLLQHESAEEYREGVLADRGPLRGVDYVIMRELVGANESIKQMRAARVVAEQVQLPARVVSTSRGEPRLVEISGAKGQSALKRRTTRSA
jgi:hypothetical protein